MDTVSTVRYVKSGKFWRVSDSIFKSPHLFFWDVSAIMTWRRGASDNKNSDHQKNFGHFSDNAFLSRRIWTAGQDEIWKLSWITQDMGAYAGAEHQIKEMNSVYVVTNKVWTESPVCPGDAGNLLQIIRCGRNW